jgi:hypothetical protein
MRTQQQGSRPDGPRRLPAGRELLVARFDQRRGSAPNGMGVVAARPALG